MSSTKFTKREAVVAMFRALAVIATDPAIKAHLTTNDVKSLEQVENALAMAYSSGAVSDELHTRYAGSIALAAIERRAEEVRRHREETRCTATKGSNRCWLMTDHRGLHEDDGGDLEWA